MHGVLQLRNINAGVNKNKTKKKYLDSNTMVWKAKQHFTIRDHAFLLTVNDCNYFPSFTYWKWCHCSCLLLQHLTCKLCFWNSCAFYLEFYSFHIIIVLALVGGFVFWKSDRLVHRGRKYFLHSKNCDYTSQLPSATLACKYEIWNVPTTKAS